MTVAKVWNGSSWTSVQGPTGPTGGTGGGGGTGATGATGASGFEDSTFAAWRACGIKMHTFDLYGTNTTVTSSNLTTGQTILNLMYLPEPATITGMIIASGVQGDFTVAGAGFENRMGLYSTNGTTLTLVAQSADDPTIWKKAAGTATLVPFTSPYVAAAGYYYAAGLWSYGSGVLTTTPSIPQSRMSPELRDRFLASYLNNLFIAGKYNNTGTLSPSLSAGSVSTTGGQLGLYCEWMGCY